VLLGLFWLLIATRNGSLVWRTWVRKEDRVPSLIPLVGGFFAYLAAMVWPWESPQKWLYLFLALLLDAGSLPYLALVVVALYKEDRNFWKIAYAKSSWVFKFAFGVLGWLLFLAGAGASGIPLRIYESSGQMALLLTTLIYGALYPVFHFRLRKYKGIGKAR
jgi:hypothetical protein